MNVPTPVGNYQPSSKGHVVKGCLVMALPALLFFVLLISTIVKFASAFNSGFDAPGLSGGSFYVLGILTVLVGMLAFPLLILGSWIAIRRTWDLQAQMDPRSGKTGTGEVPEEVQRWNWGAAGLPWIWGSWHRVGLAILSFVPLIGMVWFLVMGKYGSEWAWKRTPWMSVEEFQKSQENWKIPGLIFFVLHILSLGMMLSGGFVGPFVERFVLTRSQLGF